MVNRIFAGLLIIFGAGILLMLPFTDALYDFKTDVKEDVFTVVTASGNTTPAVVLTKAPYLNDTSTIELASNLATDAPLFSSYNATSRAMAMSGFTDNATRTLEVSYDTYALSGFSALDTIISRADLIWIVGIICFTLAGVVFVFVRPD